MYFPFIIFFLFPDLEKTLHSKQSRKSPFDVYHGLRSSIVRNIKLTKHPRMFFPLILTIEIKLKNILELLILIWFFHEAQPFTKSEL